MPRLSKIGAAALAAFGWTGLSSVTASYLVVAGGGAGGGDANTTGGGGGGGGGFRTGTASLNPTQSYTVTVGAGGAGGTTGRGGSGADSVFSTITSTGGGGGGGSPAGTVSSGASGGSGGGGKQESAGGAGNTPSTSPSQGNNGGTSNSVYGAGGGGGAGAAAANTASGTNQPATAGGAGTASSISGSSVTYAGGGGGGNGNGNAAANGADGGGNGVNSGAGGDGTSNRGGGGGGAGGAGSNKNGGNGGSGIVIISYVGAQQFGGGVVTSSGGNTIHTFTTSGTLSPLSSLTANFLVVAGGGGGANQHGGGGGAGGLRSTVTNTGGGGSLESALTIDTNSIYLVTVGAGGAGTPAGGNNDRPVGTNGSNSAFLNITSTGGGGGAPYRSGVPPTINAVAGGSGGGGAASDGAQSLGGAGTANQGFAGGNGRSGTGSSYNAGGGGGAGAVGVTPTNSGAAGNGGVGVSSLISGTSTFYAGGGGGGTANGTAGGTGGNGGGGNGTVGAITGNNGSANTGGGGGGSGSFTVDAGSGGSGVVIISYPGSTQQMAGGTVTVAGGNVIHTFTSSGYLTPIVLVNNSLRFRASASAYLNRTFPSAGNRKTYTLSLWLKRGTLGGSTNQFFFGSGVSTTAGGFYFLPTDQLEINPRVNNTNTYITTTQVFRDPSAWYHIVIQVDTTQATDSNRLKLYINGVQVTALSAAVYPALNGDSTLNNNIAHWIGRYPEPGFPSPFDGYLAEYNFIDGQALTPNSFGTSNGLGVWQPIRYGGSYGTNGFYLPFTNTTSTTTLGFDFSPNGNNWTTNNISLTAGSTYDSMTDVPTLTSATTANYCTLNPLNSFGSAATISNGNLNIVTPSANGGTTLSTMAVSSGKWYWEVALVTQATFVQIGIVSVTATLAAYLESMSTALYFISGNKGTGPSGVNVAYGSTVANGDNVGVALDMDAGTLTFYKNGVSMGTAFTGISGTYTPGFGDSANTISTTFSVNFGQQPFAYTPPTGFVALNTFNLPTPTIGATASTTANKYFDATLYTGTGSAMTVTNAGGFKPDLFWIKSRSLAGSNHVQVDSVRGVTKCINSSLTNAESTSSAGTGLTSINSNGFSLGTENTAAGSMNDPSGTATYVAWQWQAGQGSTSSNTSGSITSTVSANTTAGFSVVTYTGNGSANATVGHGLGVTPAMIIVKSRNRGTYGWNSWHKNLTAGYYIPLNSTSPQDNSVSIFPAGGVTSTVWNTGGDSLYNNQSTITYVAYCFAQVAGYSAFGSYTGNGSTDGTFIYTGFRPKFILIKRSDSGAESWYLYDTVRDTYNVMQNTLQPNQSNAEAGGSARYLDALSNGFKIRTTDGAFNGSGGTYIYMAFAENPFKYANAR